MNWALGMELRTPSTSQALGTELCASSMSQALGTELHTAGSGAAGGPRTHSSRQGVRTRWLLRHLPAPCLPSCELVEDTVTGGPEKHRHTGSHPPRLQVSPGWRLPTVAPALSFTRWIEYFSSVQNDQIVNVWKESGEQTGTERRKRLPSGLKGSRTPHRARGSVQVGGGRNPA